MALEDTISALLEEAAAQGASMVDVRRLLRQKLSASILAAEHAEAAKFTPRLGALQWMALKEFLRAPVQGEALLGHSLKSIETAIATDDQPAFWTATLTAIRMMRRQLQPTSKVFGKEA